MQPDLLSQLREARPLAPAELREHVRRIAAEAAPAPRRRLTWRRALVIAVPVAAVVAGAAIVLQGGGSRRTIAGTPPFPPRRPTQPPASPAPTTTIPAPSPNRVQRISMSLQLRVRNTQAVSDATKEAVSIARSLGGYPASLNVDAAGRTGYAHIVLRLPKEHVQQAVSRLSALGTIVGENVSIQDLQVQVDATARKIERLEQRLAYWQSQPQTEEAQKQVASFTAAIAKLAAAARPRTIRAASLAKLRLELTTRPAPAPVHQGHGPLHGLGVAFRWLGIGAVYALALAAPGSAPGRALSGSARGRPPAPRERAAQLEPGLDLREDAERRLPDRQLAELGVDAAGVVGARRVGVLDLRLAHRQRLAHGPDGAEAR